MELNQHITGCILGTAVGDAIGLPVEGMSRRRVRKVLGTGPYNHKLMAGRGMCSDDTEHTVMVAQALIETECDPADFARNLAGRLRWWLLRIPAGIGFGTLRACLKLWVGYTPTRSGVASAGNGPAMRSALLGVVSQDRNQLAGLVKASTQITHSDDRAYEGALVIATAAWLNANEQDKARDCQWVLNELLQVVTDTQLRDYLTAATKALAANVTPEQYADELGLTNCVTGYVNHTVPVAIYCWLFNRHDFRATIESVVSLGGDTDTVAAIAGALAGIDVGPEKIPEPWLTGLIEWPCTVQWMKSLSQALAVSIHNGKPSAPPNRFWLLVLLRNMFFAAVVIIHGLRRLLPPY